MVMQQVRHGIDLNKLVEIEKVVENLNQEIAAHAKQQAATARHDLESSSYNKMENSLGNTALGGSPLPGELKKTQSIGEISASTRPFTTSSSSYQNVLFDFDSTILKGESLEMIIDDLLRNDPRKEEKMREIEEITTRGMNGDITFKESLTQRLRVASPAKRDLDFFVERYLPSNVTEGMKELIDELHKEEINVFIMSGGFLDVIYPFADYLGIPRKNVGAVATIWDPLTGDFIDLDNSNGFVSSKLEGVNRYLQHSPVSGTTLVVGDGYTDYILYKEKIATSFAAYTEHVSRDKVTAVAPCCAASCADLRTLIFQEESGDDDPITTDS